MFEHMRNYKTLLKKTASWLTDDGKLFVHIFCHRQYSYLYETEGDENWMGKYFFTGGIMPSEDLFFHFQDDLIVDDHWRINGVHYQKTCEAWLEKMDHHRQAIIEIFNYTYGEAQAARWFQRWRVFFMACAELFGTKNGNEWFVGHYLLNPR
jgi:cyclopropane-fatty-acyl-phospholipid synthase